jgi:hypothetical protein
MPHTIPLAVRRALVVLSVGTLGCGSDLVLPETSVDGEQTVALTKVIGDGQTGRVGETLKSSLVVRVLNETQSPVIGQEVTFELSDPAAGVVDPVTATTNSEGNAVANWTLGTIPGDYRVIARLAGGSEEEIQEFHAVAQPGEPDTLRPTSPLLQPGRRAQPVATPPAVIVVDRFGNPVPAVAVVWQVAAGEGQLTAPISNTDADGVASIAWTLGDEMGVHKLTASIESAAALPVTFTARVLF